jgi:hypothetical protein
MLGGFILEGENFIELFSGLLIGIPEDVSKKMINSFLTVSRIHSSNTSLAKCEFVVNVSRDGSLFLHGLFLSENPLFTSHPAKHRSRFDLRFSALGWLHFFTSFRFMLIRTMLSIIFERMTYFPVRFRVSKNNSTVFEIS